MVTSLSPAVPQDPFKAYVVGALKPDDFGSFEITFAANSTSSIPIQLSYKDTDGNVYNSIQDVKISVRRNETFVGARFAHVESHVGLYQLVDKILHLLAGGGIDVFGHARLRPNTARRRR